jgi:hypothetical protein
MQEVADTPRLSVHALGVQVADDGGPPEAEKDAGQCPASSSPSAAVTTLYQA